MSNQDVRKEQIALLRFEKELNAMAKTLADGASVASSTDAKVGGQDATAAYNEMKAALIKLAEVTEKAHETLRVKAIEKKKNFVEVTLGKGRVSEDVRSALSVS